MQILWTQVHDKTRTVHPHDVMRQLTDEVFTIEGIDVTFGTPECRWYRVQCMGGAQRRGYMGAREVASKARMRRLDKRFLEAQQIQSERRFHCGPGQHMAVLELRARI